jgi:membrane-associated phospholipid phosphatase
MRYLVVLLWPAVMILIFGAGYLLARRAPGEAPLAGGTARHQPPSRAGSHKAHKAPSARLADPAWLLRAAKACVIAAAGSLLVFGVMALLGLLVVHHGLAIDRPIFHWMTRHQVHADAALMKRLTKIGNTWTCWGAAVAAAVCLAVTWRSNRWLPPVVLAACIVGDHYTTLALRHTFHRLGPPTSPFGTYPSGGCDRVILFYGLIAYLLWREFSGRRATAVWIGAVIAALGFNEGYSRVYLSLHWFTDAISGLLYGGLLLAAFIAAVHLTIGPPARPGQDAARGDGAHGRAASPPAVAAEASGSVS